MKIQNIASAAALVAVMGFGFAVSANAAATTGTTSGSGETICPSGKQVDSGTGQCVDVPGMGLGFDMKMAGSSKEEHAKFHKAMRMEDQQYIASICKMPYKYRSEIDKAYCADILAN